MRPRWGSKGRGRTGGAPSLRGPHCACAMGRGFTAETKWRIGEAKFLVARGMARSGRGRNLAAPDCAKPVEAKPSIGQINPSQEVAIGLARKPRSRDRNRRRHRTSRHQRNRRAGSDPYLQTWTMPIPTPRSCEGPRHGSPSATAVGVAVTTSLAGAGDDNFAQAECAIVHCSIAGESLG